MRRPTPSVRRFGRLTDSLRRAGAGERARVELDRARREFVDRSDSLRLRMRQWEDSTYQGYDSIVQGLARRSGARAGDRHDRRRTGGPT